MWKDTERKETEWRRKIEGLDDFGRYRLAKSAGLPREVFYLLLEDAGEMVRHGIAENREAPEDIILRLAADPHPGVRLAVITSHMEARPEALFDHLKADPALMVREEVALNPLTPHHVLVSLTEDPSEHIRSCLVKNASCGDGVLRILAEKDDSHDVRSLAKGALSQRG